MKNEAILLEDNIQNFLNKCSAGVGRFADEMFNIGCFTDCLERNIESPIEQILFIALKTLIHLNHYPEAEVVKLNGEFKVLGFGIYPQFEIGPYRVDFLIEYGLQYITRSLVVECDSQKWHERTEEERRYEKARDRYLQKAGHKIFHYTGKEILNKPFHIAAEILSYLIPCGSADELLDYAMEYLDE